ncbi:hypothetical protein BKA65DRAFT_550970 [Rhexocercosporidium sp. MPI-PUGE-AT-0058]|nr:hypothetical protein BKA65DRAFT_550970 [Rhexocercosporidium sp. MPI-PUGE-AT-0058]
MTEAEHQDNKDASEGQISKKWSSGDIAGGAKKPNDEGGDPQAAASRFQEDTVIEGRDPSEDNLSSEDGEHESGKCSNDGSRAASGCDVDVDRHEFEISSIQTKIIVQQETTIARLAEEKMEAMTLVSQMRAQRNLLKTKLVDTRTDLLRAYSDNEMLRKTLANTHLETKKKEIEIATFQTRECWALVQKDTFEKRCGKQAAQITTMEGDLKTSKEELELSKDELQSSLTESKRLKKDLQDAQEKVKDLQASAESSESKKAEEVASINAKHEAEIIDMKKQLAFSNESIKALTKRMNSFEKAKGDEEEKKGKAQKQAKVLTCWSSKFVSSKRFQPSAILLILFAFLFLASTQFGMFLGGNHLDLAQSNNVSTLETERPFDYVMPTPSALEDSTPTSVFDEEATYSIEPGYFGDFSVPSFDIKDAAAAEDEEAQDSDADTDHDETPKVALTRTERIILLVAIPVTVTMVAKLCDRWS